MPWSRRRLMKPLVRIVQRRLTSWTTFGVALLPILCTCGTARPAPPAAADATSVTSRPQAQPTPPRSESPAEPADEPTVATSATEPKTADNFRVSETGLGIEDLVLGHGAEAAVGSTLVVHYVGTLEDGTRFDSSRERGLPFELELGAERVIPAWEEGLVGMRVGGLRRLVVPPHLAYGARGQPPSIPPDAILEFVIELLDVH